MYGIKIPQKYLAAVSPIKSVFDGKVPQLVWEAVVLKMWIVEGMQDLESEDLVLDPQLSLHYSSTFSLYVLAINMQFTSKGYKMSNKDMGKMSYFTNN